MQKITWAMLQKEKKAKVRKEKTKEVVCVILFLIGLIMAMAIAGGTYPD